jgi:hypothetical protein
MTDPMISNQARDLEPAVAADEQRKRGWSDWLVYFLRVMAFVSMIKGLYHWAYVCGVAGQNGGFEGHALPWQAATVFFAVIDLVAAVGLWLAAPWGAVVWLTSSISMIAVELFFPQIYGGSMEVVFLEGMLIAAYLVLAIFAAREQPA